VFGRGLPLIPVLCGIAVRIVAAPLTRVRVEGRENVPASGGLLVICNHASNADGPVLVGYLAPALGRPMTMLGKEEAMRWPLVGWGMRQNGVVGIRRGATDLEAFRIASKTLDDGRVLIVFPEGTRSRDGKLQPAKEGATVLAVRSGAPILPVAIAGSHRFWPRGKLLPRPFRGMKVRIGPIFHLAPAGGPDRREAMRRGTAELMSHIAELLPEDQRGVYGDTAAAQGTVDSH
jgi:1-acyl-sn-glycerol-3-phosphate acyltransferase